jgi:hypothetical protein
MSRDPLPPITLGEVRRLGFPLSIPCGLCNHSAVLPLDAAKGLPDDATMRDVARRLRCTKCARPRGGSVQPYPRLWIAHLRQTGQRHPPSVLHPVHMRGGGRWRFERVRCDRRLAGLVVVVSV